MGLPGPTVFRGGVRVWDQVLWLKASGDRGPHCSPVSSLVPKGVGRRVTSRGPLELQLTGSTDGICSRVAKCPGFARWKDNSLKWKQKDANVQKEALGVERARGTPTAPATHRVRPGVLGSFRDSVLLGA